MHHHHRNKKKGSSELNKQEDRAAQRSRKTASSTSSASSALLLDTTVYTSPTIWHAAALNDTAYITAYISTSCSSSLSSTSSSSSVPDSIDILNGWNESPLLIASSCGHVSSVLLLLSVGANPNLSDCESGWTSLHRACYKSYLTVAAALVQAGADVGKRDWEGRTPLELLMTRLEPEVFRWGNEREEAEEEEEEVEEEVNGREKLDEEEEYQNLNTSRSRSKARKSSRKSIHRDAPSSSLFSPSRPSSLHHHLYSYGFSDFQLGYSNPTYQSKPRLLSSLTSINPIAFSCTRSACAVLSSTGSLYTFGTPKYGLLGQGSYSETVVTPTKVTAGAGGTSGNRKWIGVSMCDEYLVVVSEYGEVWHCGMQSFWLQREERAAKLAAAQGDIQLAFCTPILKRMEMLKAYKIVAVATAVNRMVMLTATGAVLELGEHLEDDKIESVPRRITINSSSGSSGSSTASTSSASASSGIASDLPISSVYCTPHSIILLSNFGDSVWQQTRGERRMYRVQFKFSRVSRDRQMNRIVKLSVSASAERAVAVTNCGEVYFWKIYDAASSSLIDQLSSGSYSPELRSSNSESSTSSKHRIARLIPGLSHLFLVDAAVAKHHTTVVTKQGDIYTFGPNVIGTGTTIATASSGSSSGSSGNSSGVGGGSSTGSNAVNKPVRIQANVQARRVWCSDQHIVFSVGYVVAPPFNPISSSSSSSTSLVPSLKHLCELSLSTHISFPTLLPSFIWAFQLDCYQLLSYISHIIITNFNSYVHFVLKQFQLKQMKQLEYYYHVDFILKSKSKSVGRMKWNEEVYKESITNYREEQYREMEGGEEEQTDMDEGMYELTEEEKEDEASSSSSSSSLLHYRERQYLSQLQSSQHSSSFGMIDDEKKLYGFFHPHALEDEESLSFSSLLPSSPSFSLSNSKHPRELTAGERKVLERQQRQAEEAASSSALIGPNMNEEEIAKKLKARLRSLRKRQREIVELEEIRERKGGRSLQIAEIEKIGKKGMIQIRIGAIRNQLVGLRDEGGSETARMVLEELERTEKERETERKKKEQGETVEVIVAENSSSPTSPSSSDSESSSENEEVDEASSSLSTSPQAIEIPEFLARECKPLISSKETNGQVQMKKRGKQQQKRSNLSTPSTSDSTISPSIPTPASTSPAVKAWAKAAIPAAAATEGVISSASNTSLSAIQREQAEREAAALSTPNTKLKGKAKFTKLSSNATPATPPASTTITASSQTTSTPNSSRGWASQTTPLAAIAPLATSATNSPILLRSAFDSDNSGVSPALIPVPSSPILSRALSLRDIQEEQRLKQQPAQQQAKLKRIANGSSSPPAASTASLSSSSSSSSIPTLHPTSTPSSHVFQLADFIQIKPSKQTKSTQQQPPPQPVKTWNTITTPPAVSCSSSSNSKITSATGSPIISSAAPPILSLTAIQQQEAAQLEHYLAQTKRLSLLTSRSGSPPLLSSSPSTDFQLSRWSLAGTDPRLCIAPTSLSEIQMEEVERKTKQEEEKRIQEEKRLKRKEERKRKKEQKLLEAELKQEQKVKEAEAKQNAQSSTAASFVDGEQKKNNEEKMESVISETNGRGRDAGRGRGRGRGGEGRIRGRGRGRGRGGASDLVGAVVECSFSCEDGKTEEDHGARVHHRQTNDSSQGRGRGRGRGQNKADQDHTDSKHVSTSVGRGAGRGQQPRWQPVASNASTSTSNS